MNTSTKNDGKHIWLILDKYGSELPRHYSGRPRTYEEANKLIEGLNIKGEYAPYKMISIEEKNSQESPQQNNNQ